MFAMHNVLAGRKAGKGCFVHTPGAKRKLENDEATKIFKKYSVPTEAE